MKNILLVLIIFLSVGNIATAEEKRVVEVRVGEKIPGLGCTLEEGTGERDEDGLMIPAVYICPVGKGTDPVVSMLGGIIKYFTFLAGLFAIMFIVYNGILYSMGGAEQSLKDESKKRIIQTLIGVILLLMSGYILQFIAPWVYK